MHYSEDMLFEVRLSAVNKIINEKENCKDMIKYLLIVNSIVDYKNLLLREGEYSVSVEMTYITYLFSNYLFRVHCKRTTKILHYGIGSNTCHLLFSGNNDTGYFAGLQNHSHTLKEQC